MALKAAMNQPYKELVVTKLSFLGEGGEGSLRYPGEIVRVPLKIDPDTGDVVGDGYNDNLAEIGEAVPTVDVPIKGIGPHADGAFQPQGLPPGAVQINGMWYTPAVFEDGLVVAPAQRYVQATAATDPDGVGQTMRSQHEQAVAQREVAQKATDMVEANAQTNADNRAAARGVPSGAEEQVGSATVADAERTGEFDKLSKDQLVAYLTQNEVSTDPKATKAQLIEQAEAFAKSDAAA